MSLELQKSTQRNQALASHQKEHLTKQPGYLHKFDLPDDYNLNVCEIQHIQQIAFYMFAVNTLVWNSCWDKNHVQNVNE